MGLRGVLRSQLRALYDAGYNSLDRMLHAPFEEILKVDGFQAIGAQNLAEFNSKVCTSPDVAALMQASECFPCMDKKKARRVLESLHTTERFMFFEGYLVFNEEYFYSNNFKKLPRPIQSFYVHISKFYQFLIDNRISIVNEGFTSNEDKKSNIIFY